MKLNYSDKCILITGASSGIGKEFSNQLAPVAKTLILVARRSDRLLTLQEELLKVNPKLIVEIVSCDLSQIESIDEMLRILNVKFPVIDILINNAGFGDLSLIEHADWKKQEQMIRTNVTAPVYLIHKLVGPMIARRTGGILNVGSSGGIHFMPGLATYTGTKYFINGFTESLRAELEGTGVYVGQLCPGPIATEFGQIAMNDFPMKVPKWIELTTEECCRFAIQESRSGRALIIPGLKMKFLVHSYKLVPLPLRRFFGGQLGKMARKTFK